MDFTDQRFIVNPLDTDIFSSDNPAMTPQDVIRHYGGAEDKVALAACTIGVTRATVYNWIKAGRVPDWWEKYFELDSRGRLRRGKK